MLDDADVTTIVVAKNSSNQFEKQVTINGLDKGTFYVRAYAKSSAGVNYGTVLKTNPDAVAYLSLPTFIHDGITFRVHPDLGSTMTWPQAMDACNNLTYGGYSDWILPSQDVLNTMYIHKNEIGGFSSTYYWSSTSGAYAAWMQNFDSGTQTTDDRSDYHRVRCVRKEN